MKQLTSAQLANLAKDNVKEDELDKFMKEAYFREYARVFLFLCKGAAMTMTETNMFGYYLTTKNTKGEPINLEIQTNIGAHRLQKPVHQ